MAGQRLFYVIQTFGCDCAQFINPKFFCPLPLSTSPAVIIFQTRDNQVGDGVCLKMLDQGSVEVSGGDVAEVLCETGVNGMLCFSNVMFMTEGAGDDINDVGGEEGCMAQGGERSVGVGVVNEFSVSVMVIMFGLGGETMVRKFGGGKYGA